MKPSTAEGEWFGLEAAQACYQFGETGFAVVGDEYLPIRPTPVLQHSPGKPRSMALRIEAGPVHIPEQVI